jgi:hypothetical protein
MLGAEQLVADDVRDVAADEVDVGHQGARRGRRRSDLQPFQCALHGGVAYQRHDAQIDRAMIVSLSVCQKSDSAIPVPPPVNGTSGRLRGS